MTRRDERAEFREFVRRAHPDRGGDPAVFVAGLAERRGGRSRAGERGDDDRDGRFDGPVVGLPHGFRARWARWRERRTRDPRVQ